MHNSVLSYFDDTEVVQLRFFKCYKQQTIVPILKKQMLYCSLRNMAASLLFAKCFFHLFNEKNQEYIREILSIEYNVVFSYLHGKFYKIYINYINKKASKEFDTNLELRRKIYAKYFIRINQVNIWHSDVDVYAYPVENNQILLKLFKKDPLLKMTLYYNYIYGFNTDFFQQLEENNILKEHINDSNLRKSFYITFQKEEFVQQLEQYKELKQSFYKIYIACMKKKLPQALQEDPSLEKGLKEIYNISFVKIKSQQIKGLDEQFYQEYIKYLNKDLIERTFYLKKKLHTIYLSSLNNKIINEISEQNTDKKKQFKEMYLSEINNNLSNKYQKDAFLQIMDNHFHCTILSIYLLNMIFEEQINIFIKYRNKSFFYRKFSKNNIAKYIGTHIFTSPVLYMIIIILGLPLDNLLYYKMCLKEVLDNTKQEIQILNDILPAAIDRSQLPNIINTREIQIYNKHIKSMIIPIQYLLINCIFHFVKNIGTSLMFWHQHQITSRVFHVLKLKPKNKYMTLF